MGAEVRMVIRGDSLAHRLLRSRLMSLLAATPALDIVLEVWAITVAATLAASLAAFFRARHVEHMQRS